MLAILAAIVMDTIKAPQTRHKVSMHQGGSSATQIVLMTTQIAQKKVQAKKVQAKKVRAKRRHRPRRYMQEVAGM